MSIHIDPKAVLKRLNQLGYCQVTQEQLKEFIRDLKKLIKSDGKKHNSWVRDETEEDEPSFDVLDGMETTIDSISTCHRNTTASSFEILPPHLENRENTKIFSKFGIEDLVECSDISSSSTSSISSSDTSVFSGPEYPLKERTVTRNTIIPLKPKSSFIRPWRLTHPRGSGTVQRTDPVALYHHYQTLWKQQKLPGEDKRADLRWSIREMMMGHDVNPRPTVKTLSVERVNCRPKKKWEN